jgi:hypothetical protein|tara:strand:+ start:191 stop:385 length:195 start_codon:yes stop_codon:yes gene_type:complete
MATRPLPVAPLEYLARDEQVTRRTIENSFEDLESKVDANRNKTSKESSLALRRFQFLLMGASNG